MTTIEDKQLALEGDLYTLSPTQLTELAENLEVPVAKYTGKSRMVVINVIREQINEILLSLENDEDKKTKLVAIRNFIQDKPPPLEDTKPVKTKPTEEKTPSLESTKSGETNPKSVVDVSKIFRRDFKIKGQIGSPREGNQLSFINLARQIETAVSKGYDESEIVEAVIQAISPGTPLRSYLESTADLKLPRLRQILRSHYREHNATELYQQLASITQSPKEDAQTFLMRALDLRQKIIFASKEEDVSIKYDNKLVQSLFLHSIDMGLLDDGIRARMQPFLKNVDITDEELIKEINISVSMETERKNKLSNLKHHPVKATCSQAVSTPAPNTPEVKDKGKVNVIDSLRAEIESLRGSVSALMLQQQAPQEKPRPNQFKVKVCSSCQTEGNTTCNHCYHCGSTDHFARGCRKKPRGGSARQGNPSRLPPRDRE